MVKIKYIEDTENNKIFPVTHEKAVRDSNGVTLESKLQMQTELINQNQMAIGAVPSDNTPTENSTNWVTSGGIYNETHRLKIHSIMSDVIPEYIVSGEEEIDQSLLTTTSGTLGSGGKWVMAKGKHKALPVIVGEKYVIKGDGNGFWGWLTSSYSPPSEVSTIPYLSGYQRELQKDAVAVTVPSGAAYLVFTTENGAGVSSTWEIYSVSSYQKRFKNRTTKFRYASWNIGQFVYTDWNVGDNTHVIPSADANEYALKYKSLINDVNADVLGICEYNPSYSASNLVTKNVIFQCYKQIYEGTKTGANSNTIMFNDIEYVGKEEITYSATGYNRYYTHMTVRMAGENVHIVQTHLDHTYNAMRVSEINEVISAMSGYRYVIIAGDFNTGDESTIETELAAFKNAGYTMANDGYIGLVVTSLTQEYVDNIVVKGFSMSNIHTRSDSGTLSDHLLIYCDLIML